MGSIRSYPENHVNTMTEKHDNMYFVTVSCCGWQHFMEDYEVSITDNPLKLFAILDGHHGPEAAQFCQKKIPQLLHKNQLIKMGQLIGGLENMLAELEFQLAHNHQQLNKIRQFHSLPSLPPGQYTRSGCSIGIVLIGEEQIIISNIGECKCYVTYKKDQSKAVLYSGNHTGTNKEEQNRVIKNGGFVTHGLVNGMYPYSRSLGDFHLKIDPTSTKGGQDGTTMKNDGLITNEPSIFSLRREDIDRVIIGSSGSWQKPDIILKTMMEMGKNPDDDRDLLDKTVTGLLAENPQQSDGTGLKNIMLTCICLQ